MLRLQYDLMGTDGRVTIRRVNRMVNEILFLTTDNIRNKFGQLVTVYDDYRHDNVDYVNNIVRDSVFNTVGESSYAVYQKTLLVIRDKSYSSVQLSDAYDIVKDI